MSARDHRKLRFLFEANDAGECGREGRGAIVAAALGCLEPESGEKQRRNNGGASGGVGTAVAPSSSSTFSSATVANDGFARRLVPERFFFFFLVVGPAASSLNNARAALSAFSRDEMSFHRKRNIRFESLQRINVRTL